MATDIATLGIRIDSDGVPKASDRLKTLTSEGGKAEGATNKLSSSFAGLAKYATAAAAAMVAWKLAKYVEEATMLAARVETLGVVMKVVGNNAGYTGAQMDGFVTGLKKMGITTQESMNSLIKMAGAQMDLTKASQLARIAQDAAVIGGINSSEAFGRMINGIRSGETEQLKGIGINVQQEAAQKKYAASLGKTKEQLTATEKTQAMLNAVLDYGKNIAGAYESAMSTAGKTMSSLARPAEEIKLLIGSTFTPALNDSVRDLYALLNNMAKSLENNKQILSDVGFWFKYIYFVGKTTVLELVNVWHLAELAANKFGEAIANALYLMQGGSLNGRNPFAGMVTWFAENTAAIKKDILENNTSVKKSWDDLANYGTTGRMAAQEQAAISESRARKERERREAMQATAAEQKKAAAESLKNLKEQETAFYDLGQEIERTSDTAERVFKIMTMGGGDLKTDRYNVTNPINRPRTSLLDSGGLGTVAPASSSYSLMDNSAHSFNTQPDPKDTAEDYDKRLRLEKDFQNSMNQVKLDAAQSAVGIMRSAAGDNKALQIAAMMAEKALAIARIMINTEVAASAAIAAAAMIPVGGTAIGIANAATIRAMGYVSMGMVAASGVMEGMNIAGARANGGPVSSGLPYLVNENTPNSEIFVPSQNGAVLNTKQAQEALKGGSNVTVNQTFSITGVAADIIQNTKAIAKQAADAAKSEILNSMNRGGEFALASGRMR